MNIKKTNLILDEIKNRQDIKNDSDLAKYLEVSRQVVGNWRVRGFSNIAFNSRLVKHLNIYFYGEK